MNEIVNKFLLVGNNFMPEIHSNQPGCGPFTKNKERIENFMQIFMKMNVIGLFSTRYGLWQNKSFSKKNSIR